ncbi:DUF5810 domain-containing protein [Halobaculum roseum]|uniref:DUF5810 domain-containing protein n=1 Tax=Halobaculum roseum TaxID=2175149 RepID=A0ABD5MM65_9EURY|nr:DUF5810 domain-containing protein [Halobaculum roseum]QZY01248.1 DUF5810 domain-containing protein [Halobaculum roseum]
MGYACPVCETPQRDGEHLANHLAFTAMLHGDEHEDWLDEHVDDWGDRTPADLASAATEFAEETEYDEVFEDTTGNGHGHHDHAHGDPARSDVTGDPTGGAAEAVVDEAVESVLEEAQELTEEMYGLDEDGDADGDDGGPPKGAGDEADDATEE